MRLLAGQSVYARFWKLAVPDWRGRHPRDWVPDSLSEAIGRGQDRRILALVQCFVTAGAIEQLIEAITGPRAMADLVSAFPRLSDIRLQPNCPATGSLRITSNEPRKPSLRTCRPNCAD